MKEDFTSRSSHSGKNRPPKGKNLPEVVNDIIWAKQLQAKVCVQFDHSKNSNDEVIFNGFTRTYVQFQCLDLALAKKCDF